MKRTPTFALRLVRTRDILRSLGRKKGKRILVGFALEVQDAVSQALLKYKKKNLDYVILNSPRTFAQDQMDAVVYRDGQVLHRFRRASKAEVASWIAGLLG